MHPHTCFCVCVWSWALFIRQCSAECWAKVPLSRLPLDTVHHLTSPGMKKKSCWPADYSQSDFFNSSKDGFLYLNEDNLINVVNMQMCCNYFSPPVVCGQIGGCPTTPPRRSSLMMLSCPFGSSELQHPFGWQGRHRSHTSWLRIWVTSKHHLWRHHQREGCHIVYDGTKRF